MADFTNMFANAFKKHDDMTGVQVNKSQTQILDINSLGSMPKVDAVSATPENNAVQKAYEKSKYPELAGKAKLVERKEAEARYKSILDSITREEFDSLNYLQKQGGYIVIEKSILKSLGETGESLHTERLEEWGLTKRDKIDSDLIQFTIKSQGKRILRDLKKITGVE